jgi:hypothetical protein
LRLPALLNQLMMLPLRVSKGCRLQKLRYELLIHRDRRQLLLCCVLCCLLSLLHTSLSGCRPSHIHSIDG